MKFGLSVPVQHLPDEPGAERIAELIEQVKLTRDFGFDSISVSQHYLAAPFQYFQPIPLLVRIAAESGEMMLITNILLLPLYNPVDLAEQLATLKHQVQFYRNTLQALGKPFPEDFPLSKELYLAPDRHTALREAQPYLEAKYRAYSQWGQDRELPATETFAVPFETLVQDRFILGDPDDCIRHIRTHQEQLGITHMKFRVHWPGMPHELVMRTIRLLGEKVLPACR